MHKQRRELPAAARRQPYLRKVECQPDCPWQAGCERHRRFLRRPPPRFQIANQRLDRPSAAPHVHSRGSAPVRAASDVRELCLGGTLPEGECDCCMHRGGAVAILAQLRWVRLAVGPVWWLPPVEGEDLNFLLRFRVQLGKIILSPSLNYEQSLQFLLPYAA